MRNDSQTLGWPIKVGIGTPRVEQNQTSQSGRGNRSPMVRRLIWLRNPKGLHFRTRNGVSPGSMTCISKGRIDGWSLLAKSRGSRSWVLVGRITCCECNVNCCSMRGFLDFCMFFSHVSHLFIMSSQGNTFSFPLFFSWRRGNRKGYNCRVKKTRIMRSLGGKGLV